MWYAYLKTGTYDQPVEQGNSIDEVEKKLVSLGHDVRMMDITTFAHHSVPSTRRPQRKESPRTTEKKARAEKESLKTRAELSKLALENFKLKEQINVMKTLIEGALRGRTNETLMEALK